MSFETYISINNTEKTKLFSRIYNLNDSFTNIMLQQNNYIKAYGTYYDYDSNFDENKITIIYPIIITFNINKGITFSKKISLINLCKTFILCCKRHNYNLSLDNINKICCYLISDYIIYLSIYNNL